MGRIVLILVLFGFAVCIFSSCSAIVPNFPGDEHWNGNTQTDYSKNENFVDPSDMGSYQHSDKQNRPSKRRRYAPSNFEEKQFRRTVYYKNGGQISANIDSVLESEQNKDFGQAQIDSRYRHKGNIIADVMEETRTILESNKSGEGEVQGSRGMIFLKRVIASLLRQMNIRSHFFGPKEAITIDLQAEISHEDLTTLNKFISSKSDNQSQGFLVGIDNIVSNLFHVVSPTPTVGFYEYMKEIVGFGMFYSMKFWLTIFSTFVVFLLTIILLIQTYSARSPVKVLLYGLSIFFILSCVWVFAEFYENARAVNSARLNQYQTVPKDCNFDNLGYVDSWGYYIRVHMFGYEDRCEQYHKEILIDPYYKTSPVEAISETFSKLIFHPMEYVGDKMGKFFGGVIAAVPFWLQPILLLLIFIFGFLGIFGFSLRTPFLSIEPVQRVLPQLEGSPIRGHATTGNQQQIIERPPAEIVRAALKDASTSTDDLEDYISNQNSDEPGSLPTTNLWHAYFALIQAASISMWYTIIQILSLILREVPMEHEDNEIIPDVHPPEPEAEENFEAEHIVPQVPIVKPELNSNFPRANLGGASSSRRESEDFSPNSNFCVLDQRNTEHASPQKNDSDQACAYEWVYVEDSLKENAIGVSVNSSCDSLNLEGGGDCVRHNFAPQYDILFPKVRIGKSVDSSNTTSGTGDSH